uniref:PHD-type domain-containing protein n=1 Tax=Lygus hesperus TaxID=30085 RepID=A0A0K8TDL0_LYGHE
MPNEEQAVILHCEKCEQPLPADQQSNPIFCQNCVSTFHPQCSGIQYANWRKLPATRKENFTCRDCKRAEKPLIADLPQLTQAVIQGVTSTQQVDPAKTSRYLQATIDSFNSFNVHSPNQIMHFLLKLHEIALVSPTSIPPIIKQLSLKPSFAYFKQLLRRWNGPLTYETFSNKIKTELLDETTILHLTLNFIQRLQRPNESLRDFVEHVWASNSLLQVYEPERLIKVILAHVKPDDRQFFTHTTCPATEEELYTLVQIVEAAHRDFNSARQYDRPSNKFNQAPPTHLYFKNQAQPKQKPCLPTTTHRQPPC